MVGMRGGGTRPCQTRALRASLTPGSVPLAPFSLLWWVPVFSNVGWEQCYFHLFYSTPSALNDQTSEKQIPRNCYCPSQWLTKAAAKWWRPQGGWLPSSQPRLASGRGGVCEADSSPGPPPFLLLCHRLLPTLSSSLPTPPSLPAGPGGEDVFRNRWLPSLPSVLPVN